MAASFFARAALFISLAFATNGLKLQNRDLTDNIQQTIFTPANATGLFVIINVNGQDVPVQIDFASGDLYIAGPLTGAGSLASTSTQAAAKFDFLDPPVSGTFPINLGVDVSVGNQTITQDLILDPNVNKGLAQEFPDNPVVGVLGFGSTPLSAVANGVKQGKSPMDEVYSQVPQHPYSTILFAGSDESLPSTLEFAGLFTVGKTIDLNEFFPNAGASGPDLSQISKQPQIALGGDNSFTVSKFTVGGTAVSLTGDPKNSGPGSALITTTDLWSVADITVVQALYSTIQGASLNQGSGVYDVPCNAEVNATITIENVDIPLDPATLVIHSPYDDTKCVGSVRANKAASTPTNLSLGTSFLPNVYLLIGYADSSLTQPILKLLPLTNPSDAHQYFTSSRTSASWTGSSSSSSSSSSPSSPAKISNSGEKATGNVEVLGSVADNNNSDGLNLPSGSIADQLRHCLPAIIIVVILVGLLAIGGVIFAIVRRRRSGSRAESAYRNIHYSDNMDSSKHLYGHDEESSSKYSDPYHDRA